MVTVSNFNLQYNSSGNGKQAGQQVAEAAVKTASDALINALIGAGGGKEIAAAGTRQAKTVADNTTAVANINQQQQLISTALQTITQMVQSGQLDINTFQNMLTQVMNTITDNNTKVDAMNEQMQALTKENEEIQKELEILTNETVNDLSSETTSQPNDSNKDTKTGSATQHHSAQKNSTNPNQSKIDALLEKLNVNKEMIAVIQASVSDISSQQTAYVEQGQSVQQQSEQKHTNIVSSIQNFAQTKFTEFSSALGNAVSKGIQTQQAYSAEGLTQQSTDQTAASTLLAKAAAKSTGGFLSGLVTFGLGAVAGGAAAAKDTIEAGLFNTAAGLNSSVSATALGNKPVLQQLGDQLGNTLAQSLSQQVNSQLQGAITEITNQILGTDVASAVSPKIMDIIQDQQKSV